MIRDFTLQRIRGRDYKTRAAELGKPTDHNFITSTATAEFLELPSLTLDDLLRPPEQPQFLRCAWFRDGSIGLTTARFLTLHYRDSYIRHLRAAQPSVFKLHIDLRREGTSDEFDFVRHGDHWSIVYLQVNRNNFDMYSDQGPDDLFNSTQRRICAVPFN